MILTTESTLEAWEAVAVELESILEDSGFDALACSSFMLALEEAFVNISMYAYGGEVGKVTIEARLDADALTVNFRDGGTPFDPCAQPMPDVTAKTAAERSPGGLGIFLIRKNTDELSYRRENGENILTMKKYRNNEVKI